MRLSGGEKGAGGEQRGSGGAQVRGGTRREGAYLYPKLETRS